MKVSLLVPFKTDSGPRERAWRWIERKWRTVWPALEIVEGRDLSTPFCKSAAVNDAALRATGDVFVIADGDVYLKAIDLRKACEAVHLRQVPWLLPWNRWLGLSEEDSLAVISSDPRGKLIVTEEMRGRLEPQQHHVAPGSLQVVSREAFILVGGYDERFRGWGGDDSSFRWAMDTLWGKLQRRPHHLVHLWHPRSQTSSKRWAWEGQDDWTHKPLEQRYKAANGNPRSTRALIAERPGFVKPPYW